jgi:hypothetical protein
MPPIVNPRVIQLNIASARNAAARICTGQCGHERHADGREEDLGANSATMPHAPKKAVLRVCRIRVFMASAYTGAHRDRGAGVAHGVADRPHQVGERERLHQQAAALLVGESRISASAA